MKWGMTQLHNWFYFTLSFSSSTPWKTSCFFPSKHVGFSHHSLFQDWIGLEPTMTLVENAWNPGFETVKIFGERLGKPRIEVVDIPMKTSCCREKSGVFEWFRSFQPIFYQVGWGKPIGNQKKNGLTSWTTAAQDRSMVDLHAIYCDHQNCGSEPSETWGLYKHNMWMVGIVAYLGKKNHKKMPSSRTNCRTCTLGGSSCKWFAVLCSKHLETYEQSNIFMYWIPKRKHAWIP